MKKKSNVLQISDDEKHKLLHLLSESKEFEQGYTSEDDILELEDTSSNYSNSDNAINEFTTHYNCDHYKVTVDRNGLNINMITAQESTLLDLIDKINDKDRQRQKITKLFEGYK